MAATRLAVHLGAMLLCLTVLAACTTVKETREQVNREYQQDLLQKSLTGRFAIRIESADDSSRGAQGRFDWLHYAPIAQSDQSRYVLIWSSSLGQALGRIEWQQNSHASTYQVFNEKNELLDHDARYTLLARLMGREFEHASMEKMLTAMTQAFIRAESDGTDAFEWRHEEFLVFLRILMDPA